MKDSCEPETKLGLRGRAYSEAVDALIATVACFTRDMYSLSDVVGCTRRRSLIMVPPFPGYLRALYLPNQFTGELSKAETITFVKLIGYF